MVEETMRGQPLLYRRVRVPDEYVTTGEPDSETLTYGGDVRIGDLTNDGTVDFLVFRSTDGGMKPCFIGAFTIDGDPIWSVGEGGTQPCRPGPVAVHDVDGDGRTEVVCVFARERDGGSEDRMENAILQIRDGETGAVIRERHPAVFDTCSGSGANWVHHRILLCDLRETGRPGDFVIKLGSRLLAFSADDLELHWQYDIEWNEYGEHTAYIPAVGDIDGDGSDEVLGGHYLLDSDGRPRWERHLGEHMDSVAITVWDGATRAVCSGHGHVVDADGEVVLSLGRELVPHGQEARVASFLAGEGRELAIRYDGHAPDVLVVDGDGDVRSRFELNDSPNHTGMMDIRWREDKAVLYNGGVLWDGSSDQVATLPGLPPERGPEKMGWYHCIPADVCGDSREEAVVYNPWDRTVFVYTPAPILEDQHEGYDPGPRQYNPRLMD